MVDGVLLSPQWRQTVMGGIRRGLWSITPLLFVAMSDEKIKVRDLRNGDWYWINKVLLDEYGEKLKPIGIAIYNCLAAHANQEGFCFPSHKHIANKI